MSRLTAISSRTTSWPKTSMRPAVQRQQRADEPDERRLAAPVGAEDAVDLAALDAQRDVVDGGHDLLLAAEREPLARRARRAGPAGRREGGAPGALDASHVGQARVRSRSAVGSSSVVMAMVCSWAFDVVGTGCLVEARESRLRRCLGSVRASKKPGAPSGPPALDLLARQRLEGLRRAQISRIRGAEGRARPRPGGHGAGQADAGHLAGFSCVQGRASVGRRAVYARPVTFVKRRAPDRRGQDPVGRRPLPTLRHRVDMRLGSHA